MSVPEVHPKLDAIARVDTKESGGTNFYNVARDLVSMGDGGGVNDILEGAVKRETEPHPIPPNA
jgi:hypothetical protein